MITFGEINIIMQEQNFKNHSKMVPGFHYVVLPALLLLIIGAAINFFKSSEENCLPAGLILISLIVIMLLASFVRSFALRAQDRAIRAEENFRYYLLTGKPFPSGLSIHQIFGLRFASDDEFVGLAQRALDEKLSNKQIKSAIIQWRSDYYRA